MAAPNTKPYSTVYDPDDLKDLLNYASTDRQRQIIKTVLSAGSTVQAAKELEVTRGTIQQALRRANRHRNGGTHMPHVPQGHKVIGMSTLTRTEDDEPQWIKTKLDPAMEEQMIAEMREAFISTLPREKAVKPAGKYDDDLCNLYIVTDYHIGMKAWPEETGEAWDTGIAEDLIYQWIDAAVKMAPRARVGVLAQLGDFLHWDGLDSVTPTSGHIVDADTRYQKLTRVAIRVVRRLVRTLLKRHDEVHIIMAEGNHDIAGSAWLREMFQPFYEDEPRVTVDNSADPYYCYEFGKVSLFFHHGHKRKPTSVDAAFAAKFRSIWGRTDHSYAHLGHLHHNMTLETSLMQVEQHRTLAAPDSHASRGAWMSGRSAPVITYHKEFGQVGRIDLTPEAVEILG